MLKKSIAVALVAGFSAGCVTSTDPYTGQQKISNTAGGAALGALAGAGVGLLAGGDDRRNALIGAGIGALAGGAVGSYMDQQEAQLRGQLQGTGVSVTRQGDYIILNMPSNITFATDSANIQPAFYSTLNSVALVLQKYNRTLVDVFGHTDSTGDANYNLELSQRRAGAVANYLIGQGNSSQRFAIIGQGESQPIASNATPEGRAENRRVEIKLSPLTGA
ncbi:MAG: cell envelope biogenesis protein OmpA [Nitratireductor sp.]|uniref:OmpA family protein n=1 Tax=Nitratireductor kimnyeongensis TaxID=430679 RepID=A0ABW0T2Z2_9HYPH|nr:MULTISPECIES: OmpA family protein [Nitratireductor]MAS12725.1 cell envelope biogenesis protein OmpA [Nitratireductor sp.]MCC5777756.1 OmpA family protein [Nitratireductor sp. B36]QZZ35276.1 OmpA family protein [Nitratireductor kimnyeongensis]